MSYKRQTSNLGLPLYDVTNRETFIYDWNATAEKIDEGVGGIDPEALADVLEGSIGVAVDLNEEESAVEVHLDMTDAGANKVLAVNADGDDVEWTDDVSIKKLSVFANDSSRYIDANPTNKTTSLYGHVKIGSAETQTDLEVNGDVVANGTLRNDDILSATLVGEDPVEFAVFNSTDNHWHVANTKVDDTLLIDGELELGTSGDLGTEMQEAVRDACYPDPTGHTNEVLYHMTTGQAWGKVDSAKMSSGLATSGQVLTADGSGGVAFGSLPNNAVFSLSGTTLTITNA